MSRLYDALHRAAQSDKAAGDLTEFTGDGPSAQPASNEAAETPWVIEEPPAWAPAAVPAPRPPAKSTGDRERSPHSAAAIVPIRAVAAPPHHLDAREDVPIREVIRVLTTRWKLIAVVVAVSLGIAAAYNKATTPLFEARARLLLDIDSQEVVPFHQDTRDIGRLDYYVTQLEVLRSPGLARKTLEKLGLLKGDAVQQSGQVGSVMRGLNVSPVKSEMGESRVISVTYRSADPKFAAQFANGLAQAYVDQNLEMRRQGSLAASAWLNDRLAELRGQVTAREGALQQYREQRDAVSLDDRQNIVVQKLAQLNAAVTSARTERVDKESLYQQLVAIQQSGQPVDTFPAIISNSFIQGLKAELASLQREKAQLAEHLGELHPDMIKVNTAIEAAQQRLDAEMAKVIEGVKNDYKASQARERGLLSALEDQKHEVLNLNQKSIGYTALQRDASSTQQIFESVLQRVKETDLAAQLQSNNARILDAAEIPRAPVWPRPGLNLMVAFLAGLFLAVVAAIALEYLNPAISRASDIEEALGLPILGTAPRVAALKSGSTVPNRLPPEFQEAIRNIRTRILLSPIAAAARTLSVTSATTGEGKTVIAGNLASSLAMAGRRVLLIDADVRRPQVHRTFDLPRSPGLTNVLTGQIKAPAVVRDSSIEGLSIVSAGDELPNMSELLDRDALAALAEGFADRYDIIVLDCPPVMAVADASIIANATSAVVFVVGSGTTREIAQAAVERLASVQAQVVGVVLNKARRDRGSAYDSYLYQPNGLKNTGSARSL